jgi:hypothetical protein
MTLFNNASRWHIAILNITLGLGVFFFIGIWHTKIGFHADDYGIIYNGQYSSLEDFCSIFKNGDIMHNAAFDKENDLYPQCQSFRNGRPSFLEVIYRPLLILIMATENKVFGLNAYATNLIHASLHTIAALVIFNILAFFTHPLLAFLCALFFAFHTALKDYFFWQCYIQASFELFCFILMLFFAFKAYQKRYSTNTNFLFIFLSLFFFLLALFTRETLLFFPGIVIVGAYLYRKELLLKHFFSVKKLLMWLFIISLPNLIYLATRIWAYPLTLDAKRIGIQDLNKNEPLTTFLRNKFYDLITYVFDLLGMKAIPSGFMLLKISILLGVALGIFFLWKKSSQKKLLLLLAAATIMLSWPSIIFFHSSRYLYLPVFCLSIFIGLLFNPLMKNQLSKVMSLLLLGLYIATQASITIPTLKAWSTATGDEQKIRLQMAVLSAQHHDAILLGCPSRLMGMAHAMSHKLFKGGNTANIQSALYCYTVLDGTEIKPLHGECNNNELTIASLSPKSVWFKPDVLIGLERFGKISILEQSSNRERIYKVRCELKQAIKDKTLLLWNMQTHQFDKINFEK